MSADKAIGSSVGANGKDIAPVSFSSDAVEAVVRRITQVSNQGIAAWAAVPDIHPEDCGQGFALVGGRLNRAVAKLRGHGAAMYEGLGAHGPAIGKQWSNFADVEQDSQGSLQRIGVNS